MGGCPWDLSKIVSYKHYKELLSQPHYIRIHFLDYGEFSHTKFKRIKNAGWHLSYFGDEKFIKDKLQNFSHQEYNKVEFTDEKLIKERIKNGEQYGMVDVKYGDKLIHIPIIDNDNLPPQYDIYLKKFMGYQPIKMQYQPKIIDCFTFYNELDLLTYRLNILNDVVDYFVLVEATHTHIGKEKPLFYQENKHLFEKFNDKIIHVVVDDFSYKYPNINIENE